MSLVSVSAKTLAECASITVNVQPEPDKVLTWQRADRVARRAIEAAGLEVYKQAALQIGHAGGFDVTYLVKAGALSPALATARPVLYRNADRKAETIEDLAGATIEDAWVEVDDDAFGPAGGYPMLSIRRPDGSRIAIAVMQDPEGNGPGFLAAYDYKLEGAAR